MRRVLVLALLTLGFAHPHRHGGTAPPPSGNVPVTMVQHVSSSSNVPSVFGDSGSAFTWTLPNPVQAGNALVLAMSWQYGHTISSIADNHSNPWSTTPAVTINDGSSLTSAIFVVTNAAAGVTTITVTFSALTIPFEYTMTEFSGIATSQGTIQGSAASPTLSTSGTNMTSGSFTPNANNGSGGNLIYNYLIDEAGNGSNQVSNMVPFASFSLLDADTCETGQDFFHGSEYWVQPTQAAINPGIAISQGTTGDEWFSLAIALKAGSQGAVGSGMRIVSIQHFSPTGAPTVSLSCKFPTVGNLFMFNANGTQSQGNNISTISDSVNGSWTNRTANSGEPFIYTKENATPSNSATVTISLSSGYFAGSLQLIDIAGAPASAFDSTMGVPTESNSSYLGSGQPALTSCPNATPSTSDGIMFGNGSLSTGPASGLASGSPTGAIFDFVYYPGQVDSSNMDNSDILSHVWITSTSALTWNYTMANGSQNTAVGCTAIHFKGH
jgi:hypothetical protein